jgi:hypothetical protein
MIIRLNNNDLSELNPTHGEVYLIPYYVIMCVSDSYQVGGLLSPGYSWVLHQYNWPPRYNWNIVDSGVKHLKPNLTLYYYSS